MDLPNPATSAPAEAGAGSAVGTSRRVVAVVVAVVAAAGVPAVLLSSHQVPGYGDVFLFVGLAAVPLLALPTWADTTSPVLGWIQLAYPLFFSLGFLWAQTAWSATWLWPLLVFTGNLSFVALWWLATVDDDGRLRHPLARLVVATAAALWVGVGLVLIVCWVPRPGWSADDAYAILPWPAAMRYLDEAWNAVTWTYTILLVATAALTIRFARTASLGERRIRWLIAVATTIDAAWSIWAELPAVNADTGWQGVLNTLEQFSALVAVPYLVVLLTRRNARRAPGSRWRDAASAPSR